MKAQPSRAVLTSGALAERLAKLARAQHVPFLVLRLGELERIAWRRGREAALDIERKARKVFARHAAQRLRRIDLVAHDAQSEVFSIALAAGRSQGAIALPADCRATLVRTAAALESELGLPFEGGWTVVSATGARAGLRAEVQGALERGARERERYDFFSTVGHELRSPLSAVRGYLDTVLESELDPEAARRFISIARGETLRLTRLVEGMFEISLLDLPATGAPAPARSSAREALQAALDALAPRARSSGTTIAPGTIPPTIVAIAGDPLVQILINVVGNAIEHGRPGGCVEIAARAGGRWFEFVVDDDGPGIAPEERDAVFGLGVRGKAPRGPGSGLGLALVRRFVDRAGGSVSLGRSSLGGVRVTLRLPRASVSHA